MHLPLPATVHRCVCLQLALIRSHLGAFDSEVPVSPLSNLTFSKSQVAVISVIFLSEITLELKKNNKKTKTLSIKLCSQSKKEKKRKHPTLLLLNLYTVDRFLLWKFLIA